MVHRSLEGPAIVKMPSSGANLDLQTQVLTVSASREGWQLHRLIKLLPGVLWGAGSPRSPPHLKHSALLLLLVLDILSSISGLLHMPSSLSGVLFPSLHLDLAYSFFS